eukprot:TRINITY_DN19169_c0_g1_i1.p1 TRINITY_DN19169_c0_g1~~TRINITY_DN19169_c0_g1_i1.p1  ORF type:complete len:695 (-),score=46.18 TRINITY_DN19169_c0_g1_i1:91-2175(-)
MPDGRHVITGREIIYIDGKPQVHDQRCTDCFCVMPLLIAFVSLGGIWHYSMQNGDIRTFYHGLDWQGHLCGVDDEVADKPYLYWCAKPTDTLKPHELHKSGLQPSLVNSFFHRRSKQIVYAETVDLDLANPICVHECPADASTMSSCFSDTTVTQQSPKDPDGSFWVKTEYNFRLVQNYPSHHVASAYCMPLDAVRLKQVGSQFRLGSSQAKNAVMDVLRAWPVLIASCAVAVMLGYVYLSIGASRWAGPIIYGFFVMSSVASISAGVCLLVTANTNSVDDQLSKHFNSTELILDSPTSGNQVVDMLTGVCLVMLGLAISFIAYYLEDSLSLMIGSLDVASDCIWEMPILVGIHLANTLLRLLCYPAFIYGLAWVISIGDVHKLDIANEHLAGYIPGGVARKFAFEGNEMWYVVAYVLIINWLYEVWGGLEHFVLSYATMVYFFCRADNRVNVAKAPFRGYYVGSIFHIGTIAMGAFVIALNRALYAICFLLSKSIENKTNSEIANCVSRLATRCCCCFIAWWESLSLYMNRMIMIIVVMDSKSFCDAAGVARRIAQNEMIKLAVLQHAQSTFQMGGIFFISGFGSGFTWFALRGMALYGSTDSDNFVASPEHVTVVAFILCLCISSSIMHVFDAVSDTLLYCWAWDKRYRQENGLEANKELPPRFQALLDQALTGSEEARPEPLLGRVEEPLE